MNENNTVPEFINNFTNYLLAIKNLSQSYVSNMVVTLKQFINFINVHKFNNKYDDITNISLNDIRSIVNSDIYSFIFFLAERHYEVGSRTAKIEHLRTFFDYLYRIKHNIFKEPFKEIKRERYNNGKLPNYLSLDEAKRMLNVYKDNTKEVKIRDNAIIHICLNSGLRVSEVSNLKISDLDMANSKFTIIGKGNKERTGYLNAITKDALQKYLDIRNTITTDKKNSDYLFLNKYKEKITTEGIRITLKKAYKKAGIDNNKYSTHTLRHTCATILYRSGIDIKVIQELLGHTKVETTEIYTHLYDEEVFDAMQKHPLSKFKMKNAMEYCEMAS